MIGNFITRYQEKEKMQSESGMKLIDLFEEAAE